MTFQWSHYLDLARKLVQAPDEASHRAAISRAYYAAFHMAKDHVERKLQEQAPREGSVHQFVWTALDHQKPKESLVRKNGFRLKELRNRADYELKQVPQQEARLAIQLAEMVIVNVRALAPKT